MHLLLLLVAYAAAVSAGHCRQRGRPKSSISRASSAGTTTTVQAVLPTSSSSSTTLATLAPSADSAGVPASKSSIPSGAGLKASFTQFVFHFFVVWKLLVRQADLAYRYGGCKSNTVACGFFGGFNAAVSQNLFGAGPGDGAGPACSTCYSLSSSTAGTKSIVVKINNLCPAVGNEAMCAQNGMSGTNSVGMCYQNLHRDSLLISRRRS